MESDHRQPPGSSLDGKDSWFRRGDALLTVGCPSDHPDLWSPVKRACALAGPTGTGAVPCGLAPTARVEATDPMRRWKSFAKADCRATENDFRDPSLDRSRCFDVGPSESASISRLGARRWRRRGLAAARARTGIFDGWEGDGGLWFTTIATRTDSMRLRCAATAFRVSGYAVRFLPAKISPASAGRWSAIATRSGPKKCQPLPQRPNYPGFQGPVAHCRSTAVVVTHRADGTGIRRQINGGCGQNPTRGELRRCNPDDLAALCATSLGSRSASFLPGRELQSVRSARAPAINRRASAYERGVGEDLAPAAEHRHRRAKPLPPRSSP